MKTCSRRTFLKTGGAVAAASAVPAPFIIGQPGPSANSRLNVAMVGAGGIAYMAYNGLRDENIVALCDVDENMMFQHAEKYPHIRQAKTFEDFRVMFDKMHKEIDAVCIGTPDHTHFAATMAAMEHGLHVYTQKPLTHNIWEARTLRKARETYKVVTNMGNQGHASDGIRQMREWVEAGVFGSIREVHSWQRGASWGLNNFDATTPPPPVPAHVDWDLWLGPAATVPYRSEIHPGRWRRFNAYGAGMLGDWFPHIGDGPVWTLDLHEPSVIEAEVSEGVTDLLTQHTCRIRWEFPARGDLEACKLFWHNGDDNPKPAKPDSWTWQEELPSAGSLWLGDKTVGYTDGRSSNPRLANRDEMKAFKEAGYPAERYPRVGACPFREWTRAIKEEGPEPGSNFEVAGRMTEVMLLGVLASRYGGRIEWDAANMRITNRPELNEFLKEPVREGWAYGENLWRS